VSGMPKQPLGRVQRKHTLSELCEFMLGATKAAVLRSAIDDQRS
jgi:hypothetical protein